MVLLFIRCILLCFPAISGLKINLDKSNLVSICSGMDGKVYVSTMRCKVSSIPIKNFGLPLGVNLKDKTISDLVILSEKKNWDLVISRFGREERFSF